MGKNITAAMFLAKTIIDSIKILQFKDASF